MSNGTNSSKLKKKGFGTWGESTQGGFLPAQRKKGVKNGRKVQKKQKTTFQVYRQTESGNWKRNPLE